MSAADCRIKTARLIKALKQCLTGEGVGIGDAGFHWPWSAIVT